MVLNKLIEGCTICGEKDMAVLTFYNLLFYKIVHAMLPYDFSMQNRWETVERG